jgi:hypothetical protein
MTEYVEQVDMSIEARDQKLVGIGGWLIWHAIGFVIGLIYFPVMLIASLVNYSKVARAGYGGIQAIEPIVIIGLLCFMLYTATLFFRKKRNAPGTIIIYFIVGLVIAVIFFVIEFNAGTKLFTVNTVEWLVKGIIKVPIWIPYFLVSKRVKATFVN